MRYEYEEEYKEPQADWSKVPIDTPVFVRDCEKDIWINRYFAYYEDGKVYVYSNGATSWSSNKSRYNIALWQYAKLANEEDIRKYAK